MNALGINITGQTVVFREHIFQPKYRALPYRVWRVLNGFGANPMVQGKLVRCRSVVTGSEAEFDATQIERLATRADLALLSGVRC